MLTKKRKEIFTVQSSHGIIITDRTLWTVGNNSVKQFLIERKKKNFPDTHSEVVVIILFKILCKKKINKNFFCGASANLDTFRELMLRDFTHVGE